jgi:hypothetical protein
MQRVDPNSPNSTASELVSPTTPNLLAQLWPQPGTAVMPAAEVIVTIDPPLPASIIGGTTAHLLLGVLAGEQHTELQLLQADSLRYEHSAVSSGAEGPAPPEVSRSHLLIGLSDDSQPGRIRLLGLTCDDSCAAESLRRSGLPVTEVWAQMPSPTGSDREVCAHHAPFTAHVADVLQCAISLAAQFRHDHVDTLHILLALAHRKTTMLFQLDVRGSCRVELFVRSGPLHGGLDATTRTGWGVTPARPDRHSLCSRWRLGCSIRTLRHRRRRHLGSSAGQQRCRFGRLDQAYPCRWAPQRPHCRWERPPRCYPQRRWVRSH